MTERGEGGKGIERERESSWDAGRGSLWSCVDYGSITCWSDKHPFSLFLPLVISTSYFIYDFQVHWCLLAVRSGTFHSVIVLHCIIQGSTILPYKWYGAS